MTRLMGQNMMRKDGEEHKKERHIIFPTISPKTTQNVWKQKFISHTEKILDNLSGHQEIDLVNEFAKPVSAEALKSITGLTNMTWQEMDRVSQGMIDGVQIILKIRWSKKIVKIALPPLIFTFKKDWIRI